MSNRDKYNRGKKMTKPWIVSIVEDDGKVSYIPVADRNKHTLCNIIFEHAVLVNHRINFKEEPWTDEQKQALHCNAIEGIWSKKAIKGDVFCDFPC